MFRRARMRGFGGSVAFALGAALVLGLMPGAVEEAAARPPTAPAQEKSGPQTTALSEEEALAEAKRSGEKVEVLSLRGESGDVHATPDGKLEAREYLRPVRTRVKGEWKSIDTSLAKTSDGTVAPKAVTVGLEFSGGGDGPMVRMERAGRKLALSWPGKLPEPRVEGDTATYPEVLPGVDLRLGAQEDGFTQLLVVKSAEAAASPELAELRLRMAADGMEVRRTDEGGLEAVDDGAKNAVFEASTPLMWDSSPGENGGEDGDEGGEKAASKALTSSGAGGTDGEPGAGESGKLAPVGVEVPAGGKELVLIPDQDVLRGKDTVYPVFIDPQWYSPRASAWTMASKYWASSPQWKFNGKSDEGMGYCNWDYCKPHDTKRLFYRIPTSTFAGKQILSAEFVVRNTWSASCTAKGVQLWRTKDISSSTTWNSQNASGFWIERLRTESFAHGHKGCAAKDAEFNVKSAVQRAADGKWSTMTFGMQASSETDAYGWKRFSDKAHLRVKYNRPPQQIKMSQLTMEYGGTCKKPADAARVRTLGTIYANNITDPDGDNVAVQFQAKWDSGDGKGIIARWTPALTSYKKSGSNFAIKLPTSIPQNKTVHWYARSYDGAHYSPWSHAGTPTSCYFVYDTDVPEAPVISSGEYPTSDPENPDDPWYDGVGRYGTFTLSTSATDANRYWYGINGDPVPANQVTTSGGAARNVPVLPARPGLNFITAQAFDPAGNGSEVRTYQFRVKAGQPERATWQLDEAAGAAQAEGSTPPRTMALHGGAVPGVDGAKNTAVEFNGTDGYASTDISAVNTSVGFAVSAWVKLSRMPDRTAVVAAQPGNHRPGFELYYSTAYDRWVFNQYAADDPSAGIIRAMADQPGGVHTDTWTHLVGSYNSADDLLELYVDGTLVGQTPYATPWEARRGLLFGAGSYSGRINNHFPGTIDQVQLFDKRLTSNEVRKLGTHQPVGDPGRPAIAVFDLDEQADATEISGHGGVLPAVYHGGVSTGQPGMAGKAATFNGTDGYARIGQTSGPHVITSRSFTISAWARMDRKPGKAAIIAAQAGVHRPGFELYYSSVYDRWAFNQYSGDTADAKVIRAIQPEGTTARAGEWVHLTGVHDTVADTLTLYVNGAWAGEVRLGGAFYANQSMYIGAGSYSGNVNNHFPGTIDDVRLFDRPVSADEVRQMFKQRPLLKGRWMFEESTTGSPATTPDDSAERNTMTLHGGARIGTGWIDFGGLQLDGVDDHAATSTVPVDTSASFTVTAWAQAATLPSHGVSLMSAEGTNESALNVRFTPDTQDPAEQGRWELVLPDKDGSDATVQRVANSRFWDVRDWTHLAVVYDGFAKQARLYVNGVLQEVACGDADGDGDADDPACEDLISWAEDTLTFTADRSFQVGRAKTNGGWGEYFPGTIDDVWAFQGALNESQVEELAASWFDIPTDVPAGA